MVIIDTVELDAAVTEKHSAKVEITKHPIEEGASPADHARVLPAQISIEGFLTNTPLGKELRLQRGITSDRATSTGAVGAVGQAQRSMAAIEKLMTDRKAVTVKTDFKTYTNMLVTSLDVPRDARTGEAIRFTIMMEEIRIVRAEVARINVLNRPKKKPTKKVDQAKQPGKDASESRKSIADKLDLWTGRRFSNTIQGLPQ